MRVIAYVRVSTEEQARSGLSLEAQEKKIQLYCELHELECMEVVRDEGESGKSLDRPGIQHVLARLRAKEGPEGLVVPKLDRLTRSLKDWQTLIDDFFAEKKARRLLSVEESIDTRRASGRLVLNVILTVAQWEREVISERTRDALQAKIARGERVGKVRYGFDLAGDGTTLLPNAREQEALALMKGWRDQGRSYREIGGMLEYHGYRTKEGERTWDPKTVQRLIGRAS